MKMTMLKITRGQKIGMAKNNSNANNSSGNGKKRVVLGNVAIAISVIAFLLSPLGLVQSAFAANPYIGAYRDSSTIHHPNQFTGYFDLAGSTSVSSFTGPVISIAGWETSNPSRFMWQAPTWLNPDGTVEGDPQAWEDGITTAAWIRSLALGTFGTGSTDIKYVYISFWWDSARSQITFYYEPHRNDGSYTSKLDTYLKNSADTSTNFASGWQDVTVSGTTYRFKYLQIGAESQSSTSGWKTKMYGMTYYCNDGSCSTVDLSTIVARSLVWDTTSTTYESWISYYGIFAPKRVGDENYVANADYHLKSGSTLPAGQVQWFKSSSSLPAGTQLW
jgi:hypothetical protein